MEEAGYSELASSEFKIVKALEELKEASAADIAKKLYPDEINLRPKTSLVSVLLKRLEKKKIVARSKKIGRKAFYRIAERKEAPAEKPKIEALFESMGLEKDILEALEKLKKASASDIVPIVFKEKDLRKKTAEISVYLKRMEQKGYVVRVGKTGRKAYYSIREIEEEPVTALEIPKIEEIPEFPPLEMQERRAERRIPRLPKLIFPLIIIIVFVGISVYFVTIPTPTGFLVMQKEQVNASYFLLALSEEKGGYGYSVKNVHADIISNATLELILPKGSEIKDVGAANLETLAEGVALRWNIDSIQTNESKTFSFVADVNGSVKMSANGLLTKLRNESVEPSIELSTEPGTYSYQPLNLTPASYISFLSLELSATSKNKEKENKLYVYADVDDQENGNEDLIGLQNFTGNWSGTLSSGLPAEKYTQPPYLALKSDLPAGVAIKKISAVWKNTTTVSESASAEIIREAPEEAPVKNITENVIVPLENLTAPTENITVPIENVTEVGITEQIIQGPVELGIGYKKVKLEENKYQLVIGAGVTYLDKDNVLRDTEDIKTYPAYLHTENDTHITLKRFNKTLIMDKIVGAKYDFYDFEMKETFVLLKKPPNLKKFVVSQKFSIDGSIQIKDKRILQFSDIFETRQIEINDSAGNHFYSDIIWDSATKTLTINNSDALIAFLDNAVYPVTIDPTVTIQEGLNSYVVPDSYIASGTPDTNYGTNNNLDVRARTGGNRRSILVFNVSSIVNGTSIIDSAYLQLYMFDAPSGSRTYWAYRVTQTAWTETGVTWNKYDGTNNWTAAGGDYTTTNGSSVSTGTTDGVWLNWTVTDQVAFDTVNGLAHFILRDGNEGGVTIYLGSFVSSENTTATSLRPKLVITYSVPDTTPPTITISSPLNTTYSSLPIQLNVSLSETGSRCLYNLNNTAPNITLQGSGTSFNLATGINNIAQATHRLYVYCNDTAGNMGSNNSVWFTYAAADTTPPTITITSPTNTTYSSLPILLNITTNEAVNVCKYNLNNTANSTMQNSSQTAWFYAAGLRPPLGTHRLYVYCNDTSGNEGVNNSVWFTYAAADTTPPTITITSPINTTYNSLPIQLNVSLSETGSVCLYNLNNTAPNITLQNSLQTNWFFAAGLSPPLGTHRLYVYCNDTSGNMNSSVTTYFTIGTGTNVILIAWDGVRYDKLYNELYLSGQLSDSFNSIINNGSWARIYIDDHYTWTDPGFAQILSGYGVETTNMTGISDWEILPDNMTIFEKLNERGITTAAITSREAPRRWSNNDTLLVESYNGTTGHGYFSYNFMNATPEIDYYWDSRNWSVEHSTYQYLNYTYVNFSDNETLYLNQINASETEKVAENWIANHSSEYFFLFVHFGDPDAYGHIYGGNSSNYTQGVKDDDNATATLMNYLQNNYPTTYNNTVFVVVTDHGFKWFGYGHLGDPYPDTQIDNYLAWIGISSKRWNGTYRASMYDVAPTIYELMEINYTAINSPSFTRSKPIWERVPWQNDTWRNNAVTNNTVRAYVSTDKFYVVGYSTDYFYRPDSPDLNATLGYGKWYGTSGTSISDEKLRVTAGDFALDEESNSSNYSISVSVTRNIATSRGIIYFYQQSNSSVDNGYFIQLNNAGSTAGLWYSKNGADTLLESLASMTFSNGDVISFNTSEVSSGLKLYKNGVLWGTFTVTNSSYSSGYAGFGASISTMMYDAYRAFKGTSGNVTTYYDVGTGNIGSKIQLFWHNTSTNQSLDLYASPNGENWYLVNSSIVSRNGTYDLPSNAKAQVQYIRVALTGDMPYTPTLVDIVVISEAGAADTPPLWRNQGQNTSAPAGGDAVLLSAQGYDDTGLDYAVLETNETGMLQNKSTYGSPQDMGDATIWTWSNFTWLNASTQGNTVVGWKIYYNDTTNKQNVTDSLSFTVQPSTTITMVTNMVSFGDIASGESNDTDDDAPLPFKVRNDGNININVSVSSSDNLWNAQSNPTNYYQAKCSSSSEWTVTAGSRTTYTAIPTSPTVFCYDLPYLPSEDEAEVEINITVPAEEGGGLKSSEITFTGSAAA